MSTDVSQQRLRSSRPASDILAVGFGCTVAIWTVGYLTRLPPLAVPQAVTFVLFLVCLVGAGFAIGRWTDRGVLGTALAGLLAAALNLLILGSLVLDPGGDKVAPRALIWVPGFALAMPLLLLVGRTAGRLCGRASPREVNWTGGLAAAVAGAAALLVLAGGLVTGFQAGMAVEDWPQTKAINMFLYPLARMTGGIYLEHTHRLLGALVGLGSLGLASQLVRLSRREARYRRAAALATAAFVVVVIQGVLGGLRVVDNDVLMAALHGIFGQAVFATILAVAAVLSRTWQSERAADATPSAATDRSIGITLVVLLLGQLTLGSLLRHLNLMLVPHITIAGLVVVLAFIAGVRALALHGGRHAVFRRLGLGVIAAGFGQLVLGIVALLAREKRNGCTLSITEVGSDAVGPATDAVLTTVHQAVGATLLGLSVLLVLWSFRLLRPEDDPAIQEG